MTFRLSLSVLGSNKWAKQLKDCKATNKAVGTQVEVSKAHLQGTEQHIACQEGKVTELSTRLETETKENKSLPKQVEHLSTEL